MILLSLFSHTHTHTQTDTQLHTQAPTCGAMAMLLIKATAAEEGKGENMPLGLYRPLGMGGEGRPALSTEALNASTSDAQTIKLVFG